MYWLATKRTFRSNSFDMILTNDSEMKKYFGSKIVLTFQILLELRI